MVGAEESDREPGAVAGQEQPPLADPDGDRHGKTFTAVNACYRLIKFGGARRVLFLVDRSNLGRQTYREFQQFVSPVNAYWKSSSLCTSFRGLGDGQVAPIARLHPASATLSTANIVRIGHHRQSRWYVETTVARCDEQLLLGVPIVGATRRQLNFFGRASGRSCRTYPLWDRLLWQSSIRRALSTPHRNDRGSIRFHVPIDASVDVTEVRNARLSRLIKERHLPVDANVYQRGLLPVRSPRGRRSRRSNRCLGRGGLPQEISMRK